MEKETLLRNILMLQMIPREPHSIDTGLLWEKLIDQGYEIDVRSIQRDLIRCSSVFPIVKIKSNHTRSNCWCWSQEASLMEMPKMDSMTALTFNLVESFLLRMIPNSILQYMSLHFQRAASLLNNLRGSSFSGWAKKIHVVPRGINLIPPEVDSSVYESTLEAILKQKQLFLKYRKRNANQSKNYLLNPLGLVFNQEVIYLVATKYSNTVVQHFALHRIENVDIKKEIAIIPDGFNLNQYVAEGAFHYQIDEETVQLKVAFKSKIASHLIESKFNQNQKLTRMKNGNVLLESPTKISSALKWWLLGFGDGVEVIEPKSLRDEFRKISRNMSANYE